MKATHRRLLITAAIILVFGVTWLAFAPSGSGGQGTATTRAASTPPTPESMELAQAEADPRPAATVQPEPQPEPAPESPPVPDLTPVDGVDHWQNGRQLFWQRDYETAAVELERAVRQRPGTYHPHYILGLTYFRLGDVERAEREYVAAREIDGDRPEALVNLARLYMNLEEFAEALEVAGQATEVAPLNDSGWNQLGRAHLALGQQDAAIASFAEACNLDADNAYAWNNLGYAYLTDGDFERALEPLEEAVATLDAVAYMHNNLGVVLERLGRTEDAMAEFLLAAELDPAHAHAQASAERLATVLAEQSATMIARAPEAVTEGDQPVAATIAE